MDYEKLSIELRRELHKIPETGGEEFETSRFIRKTLSEWGIASTVLFKTGVVAVLGDEKKPCIAIRCDMDALPVTEENDVEYKSQNAGKMHACGHDGHMAAVLTLAKVLKDNEKELKNCVKLIFQPAEETDGGALGMIKEGVLENPKVEKIFGFHLWPHIPVGKAVYSKEASFASAERFEIHMKGNGGHGAMPDGVKKCLYFGADIINEIKNIDEKHKKSVVSACSINSTGHHNVFADSLTIKGTIRTVIEGEREKIENEMKNALDNLKTKYECEANLDFVYEYPVAKNCEKELNELVLASKKVLGDENVSCGTFTYAAEDFAFFTEAVGGAHIKIGIVGGEDTNYPLHNPKFNIDEKAIMNAVNIFKEICLGR